MYVYSEHDISTYFYIYWIYWLPLQPWNRALKVVEETQELLVVNKPSSLPIHPCGSYRRDPLLFLEKDPPKYPPSWKTMKNLHVFFFFSHLGVYNLGSCKGFNSLIAILRNQETVEAWMMQKCNCDVQEVTLGELPGNCHLAHNSPSWGLIWIFSFNQNICVDRHSGNLGLPLKNPSFQVWIGLQVDWFYWWDLSAWYHWKGQESNYFWVIGGEFDSKWF